MSLNRIKVYFDSHFLIKVGNKGVIVNEGDKFGAVRLFLLKENILLLIEVNLDKSTSYDSKDRFIDPFGG